MASREVPSEQRLDVFINFRGKELRGGFISHLVAALDAAEINYYIDRDELRGEPLEVLFERIEECKIALTIFSSRYGESNWCLNELGKIMRRVEEGKIKVIPIFFNVTPDDVRIQVGEFGTNLLKGGRYDLPEMEQWRKDLISVVKQMGMELSKYPDEHTFKVHIIIEVKRVLSTISSSKMIEAVANDVLCNLNVSPSKEFEDFVMDDHIAKMSVLLHLESEKVRMVGIWGTSGIGKTSIARTLFSQLSRHFQRSVFIDGAFVSKSMEIYKSANPDDYNMKLHLQSCFLSKVLKKEDIMVDSLGAIEERLKHRKVLIVIDDLEDQMVLDTLVGQTQWFGSGSRIIVITKDKHLLRHRIDHTYEVCFPSKKLAFEMFSRFCFRQNCPPDDLMEFALEIVLYACNLSLGLKVLGSNLRGRDKEDFEWMLRSRNGLDRRLEKTMRRSYYGLNDQMANQLGEFGRNLIQGGRYNLPEMIQWRKDLNSAVNQMGMHLPEYRDEQQFQSVLTTIPSVSNANIFSSGSSATSERLRATLPPSEQLLASSSVDPLENINTTTSAGVAKDKTFGFGIRPKSVHPANSKNLLTNPKRHGDVPELYPCRTCPRDVPGTGTAPKMASPCYLGSQLGMIIGYLLVLFLSMQYLSYKITSLLGETGGAIDRIVMDLPKVVEYCPRQRTEITIDKDSGANPMKSSFSDAKTNADMLDSKAKSPQIQVFINFRGDIRNNFVGYLMDALQTREFNVYIDNHEPRGEDLNTLFKAIENSGIAIVVFSTRYTESKWCLEELVKIKERVNQGLLKVLPIFYKVTPTNVKRFKGEFGDHFRDKEHMYGSDSPLIKRWKEAILFVSHKFALVYDEKSDEQESKFVKTIVEEVLKMLQAISTAENGQSSCNPVSCGVSQS